MKKISFRDLAGVTLLSAAPSIIEPLFTMYFMIYMTDYSGIGIRAAQIASTVLIVARIFDLFCTPAVGVFVASSKTTKYGKYRPFFLLSFCLMAIGALMVFHLPEPKGGAVLGAAIYVMIGYLIYDVGVSFHMPQLLYRTMTTDANERGKLLIGPRYMSMALGIVMSGFFTIASRIDKSVGNMHRSFGIVVTLYILPLLLISFVGLLIVREYHSTQQDSQKVSVADILAVFRENSAFRIRTLSVVFSGLIWTLLFSSVNYYLKWTYCADLSTGAVDSGIYGRLIMVSSLLTLLPILIGSAIALPLMKKVGSPDRFCRILLLLQAIPLGLLFLLQVTGILRHSAILFFCLVGTAAFAIGCNFLPENVLAMECMDYDIFINKKDRGPVYHSVTSLIAKIQATLTSVAIASVLTSIGYIVDSKTDTFIGDMNKLPGMLTDFTVIMGLVPAILSTVAFLILRKYPITPEVRQQMKRSTE
ncbi:MAG: MFS transporter [Lachnospiraceae bacterium]|nr:MFS transporter [Lachnospiraceae bacterium]